jgi:hypothetical protein
VNHFSATKIDASLRLMLSAFVSICILQTPIPVAHAHVGIEGESHLHAHLARHHHADQVHGDEIHWHLMLPGESGEDHDSGHDDDDCPTPSVLSAGGGATPAVDVNAWETERQSRALLASIDSSLVLLSPLPPQCSLSCSVRTRAVLCVIRC